MAWSRPTTPLNRERPRRAAAPRRWGRSRFNGMLLLDPAAQCHRTEAGAFLGTLQTASGPTRVTGGMTSTLGSLVTLSALSKFVGGCNTDYPEDGSAGHNQDDEPSQSQRW
jgi:hypothetical protein